MKKLAKSSFSLFIYSIFSVLTSVFPSEVHAQTSQGLGIGTIAVPPGVDKYQAVANAQGVNIGLILFLSNMVQLFGIVMGLYAAFNIILAGLHFINNSGDASAYDKVKNQITQSVIGLILIVATYTIAGLIGLIFFGDAAFILKPKI